MATRAAADIRAFGSFGKKIVAVGRNYRDHAAELGNPVPTTPLIFLKPTSSYLEEGKPIIIPQGCTELHHEVELGVVIGKAGHHISEADAMSHVAGYALALDMTARDFQTAAKKSGSPWTLAKGYDTFCPISKFITKDDLKDPTNARIWLQVNGAMKQDGNTRDMVFSIPNLIGYISNVMSLDPGDLILTGTPSGVGPVKPGQTITAGLADLIEMTFPVA